jgi:hypothetical protein
MREATKDRFDICPFRLFVLDEGWQIEAGQMRKDFRHLLTRMRIGGENRDLQRRVTRGQAYEVSPCVSGGPDHADLDLAHLPILAGLNDIYKAKRPEISGRFA